MLASASIETDRGMSATMRAGTEMSQFRTGPNRPRLTYCIASEMWTMHSLCALTSWITQHLKVRLEEGRKGEQTIHSFLFFSGPMSYNQGGCRDSLSDNTQWEKYELFRGISEILNQDSGRYRIQLKVKDSWKTETAPLRTSCLVLWAFSYPAMALGKLAKTSSPNILLLQSSTHNRTCLLPWLLRTKYSHVCSVLRMVQAARSTP